MGPTHRLFGAFAGTAYATFTGEPAALTVIGAVVATAASNGPLSPDVDQTPLWTRARRTVDLVPLVGGFLADAMNHRALTHWWALPIIVSMYALPVLPTEVHWTFTYLLIGWISHLIGDVIFGELSLFPWGGNPKAGLSLATGGVLETGRTRRGTRLTPFGIAPVRVAIVAATVALFWINPSLPTVDLDLPDTAYITGT